MKRRCARSFAATAVSLALVTLAGAAPDLPVVKGKKLVATVQGEPITLDEFNQQLAAVRRDAAPGAMTDRQAELALLDRMIATVLIAQEARRMGLDKLPEVRKPVESYSRLALREELVERVVKDVTADPNQVEERYQAAVREWKISAALFDTDAHAKAMAAEVAAGKDFADLARRYLAEGKATKLEDGVLLKRAAMDPQIGEAVGRMAVGSTSPVLSTKSGFVIVRLEETRYPDNPEERAKAQQVVLTAKRREAVTAFDQALKKKYVKVNRELLGSLDFDAEKPGIEALAKDRRVLAEIKGEKPVTVAELTDELKFQFYHGTSAAAERKRLNAKKEQILDGMLHRKVFRKEALRLGLDRTDAYRSKVKEYETGVLFDTFLRKVIAPDVKLAEDEAKAYYAEHRQEYGTPEMIRLRSLAFADRRLAESAAESLRKGADFQWLASRADGQVDPNAKGVLTFDGRPIMMSELPDGIQKAVAGARAGGVRLYASPEGHYYAFAVEALIPAQPRPYDEVRTEIREKLVGLKVREGVDAYARKLRGLSTVTVYLPAS